MLPVVEKHVHRLQARYPGVAARDLPSGAVLITVPDIGVPPGWNAELATIRFVVPVGYPNAQPDCFFVEPAILLKNNAVPRNTGTQQIPETSDTWFWFSWHMEPGLWKANRDDLLTYLHVILSRFEQLR